MSAAAWIRAARLPAQSNIALPLFVGQALACPGGVGLSWATALLVGAFGLFDQLYIVFANDVADVDTDRDNATPTPFSGGSRVLVAGAIAPRSLLRAAIACAAAAGVVSLALAARTGATSLVGLWALAVALLHAYSFRPLRLSYRGGGEALQLLGTGLVLPLYGFVAQKGALLSFPWAALAWIAPMRLACAIATALPDEPSDRRAAKRTLVVALGARATAGALALLQIVSLAAAARAFPVDLRPALAVPASAALVGLALAGAAPGSRAMVARVGALVFATLSLEAIGVWGQLR